MAKAAKKPVFWLAGNYYECQKTFRNICNKLGDHRVIILDCDWVPEKCDNRPAGPGDVIRQLRSRDIFDDRPRVIKLKGLPPGYTELVSALQFVNDSNILVIDGPIGHRAKPPSQQFVTAKNSNFFKQIKKEGYLFEFDTEIAPGKAANWIKDVAEELGKKIEPDAALLMTEMLGGELDVLYGNLLILKDYAEGKSIKKSDVEDVCVPSFLKDVWNLTENICYRNADACVEHLQRFYNSVETESEFFGEIQKLMGALHYVFLFAVLVKDNVKDVVTLAALQKGVDGFAKIDKEEKKEFVPYFSHGFLYKKAGDKDFAALMQWKKGVLCRAFAEINKVRSNIRLKGSSSSTYQKVCLDSLIMSLCGSISYSEAESMRDAVSYGIIG